MPHNIEFRNVYPGPNYGEIELFNPVIHDLDIENLNRPELLFADIIGLLFLHKACFRNPREHVAKAYRSRHLYDFSYHAMFFLDTKFQWRI